MVVAVAAAKAAIMGIREANSGITNPESITVVCVLVVTSTVVVFS